MADITIALAEEAVKQAFMDALLKPARHSHDEAPLAAAARQVVRGHQAKIEKVLREQVEVVLGDATIQAGLRAALRQSLLDAVKHKAAGIMRTLSPHTVSSSLFEEPAARERRAIASDLRRYARETTALDGVERGRLEELADRYDAGLHLPEAPHG